MPRSSIPNGASPPTSATETGTNLVSAVVVAWGSCPLLRHCVESILLSTGVDVEVIVVDNGCDEATLSAVPDHPMVRLVVADRNLGFGGGCNLGAAKAAGSYLAFVNPDAVVAPSALAALVGALEDPDIGIATARVRLMIEPDLLNSSGGAVHYLGLGWAQGFRQPASAFADRVSVTAGSGAAMAMRSDTFRQLGGFTAEFFLYHEDAELSLRVWMAGLRVEFVPDADVLHDYAFGRHDEKLYFLERNRLLLLFGIYRRRTLFWLLPAILGFEVAIVGLATVQGWLRQKLRGWWWIGKNYRWVLDYRRRLQVSRVVGDEALVPLLASHFDAGQLQMPSAARPIDWLFAQYWEFVRARVRR
jgi:GT2 family glycosyltransferase